MRGRPTQPRARNRAARDRFLATEGGSPSPARPPHPGPAVPKRPNLDSLFVAPMLAQAVAAVPAGRWRLEMKFDGFRAVATVASGRAELWSRNRLAFGGRFPGLIEALGRLSVRDAVLDGEIVALDPRGRPSFQLLQGLARAPEKPPLFYYAFDLLRLDGRALLDLPIEKRQALLERLLQRAPGPLRLSRTFDVAPRRLLEAARQSGWEGIVAKAAGSRYEPDRRSGAWLKCKVRLEQEFVIGGYTAPRAGRRYFGALLVGCYEGDRLIYAGKVGTGFTDAGLASLHRQLARKKSPLCPFAGPAPERAPTWVEPELVCQVSFAEWTGDGRLRQGAFLGLREDKNAREVVRESVSAPA